MIIVVKLILITVMIGLSWKFATSPGMLLEKVGDWSQKKRDAGYKIFEILLCPFCGASLFSIISIGFGLAIGICFSTWNLLVIYPLIVFGSSTLTGIGWYLWLLLESKRAYFSNMEQLTYFEIKNKKKDYYNKKSVNEKSNRN